MSRFLERLDERTPLIGDGGTGAVLMNSVPGLRAPEEANLRAPEAVLRAHVQFIRAGAGLIGTNTFGANRHKLAALGLDDQRAQIVEQGVKIAREARDVAGEATLIGGSIGPVGDRAGAVPLAPDVARSLIAEQARLLEGRGVDLILLETFTDIQDLVDAIGAVREVSALPIVAHVLVGDDLELPSGTPAAEVPELLEPLGLAAIGVNCGPGPQVSLAALRALGGARAGSDTRLSVFPNVGLPARWGGRLVYPTSTPDYFADFAASAHELGASIIGGCCGTLPAHIAAIRAALEENREPRLAVFLAEVDAPAASAEAEQQTALQRRLEAGEWVVSVELDPPKGANLDGLLQAASRLEQSGTVDVVDVNDSPMARARMSALTAAVAIQHRVGIETIPHVTTRDATIVGLESQLLGAHAMGVRNVLAITGDPPSVGDATDSYGVYELDSIGLTELLTRLNEGEDWFGKAIDARTSFYTGVAVNPTADDLESEVERFRRKLDAGARFAMTQALFGYEHLDRFTQALGDRWPIPVLVGVWPVRSFELALRLHNEVPGIVVPDAVLERLRAAGPDAAAVGLAVARDVLEAARSRASGVYVIPPFRDPVAALELVG